MGGAPAEGGVDVGSFGPGEREVVGLTAAANATRGGCGGVGEPAGVRGQRDLAEPGLGHRLEGERADAVEQPVAAVGRGVVVDDQEGAAGQTADDVDRRRRRDTEGVEDELDRAERCPAGERGERPQAALVVGEQQVVAPADRRSERPTPFRLAAGRVVQHAEPVVESPSDVLHRQRPRACRGELDRQRQPIERTAQLVDRIVAVTDDRRPARWAVARRVNSWTASPSGSGASSTTVSPSMPSGTWLVHRIRSPGTASSRRTARSAAASTTCSQLSRMTVVSARRSRSTRAVSPPVTFNAAITVSTTSSVVVAVSNRASHTPPGALSGAAGGDRHGRLADTADTDDLDQPPGGEQLGQVGDDPVATDELGRHRRQVADRHGSLGRVGRRAHGGERSVVGEDLVLELLQLRSRVETELVGQQAPDSLVGGQARRLGAHSGTTR